MLNRIIAPFLLLVFLVGCSSASIDERRGIAISSDGEQISYSAYGKGSPALIFVHGWSCDGRYWEKQIPEFAKQHKVITIDLAGHGHSSSGRKNYTQIAFAKDIKAVIEKEKVDRAILVGHSFGGNIIAEAAKLMPKKIVGIVGVDTLHNVAEVVPQEVLDQMLTPMKENFVTGTKDFVSQMLLKTTNPEISYWITTDMSSAPKDVALSAITNYMGMHAKGEVDLVFKEIDIPVITINATKWPTNEKANKEKIKSYKALYIEETGHFPMLEKPDDFNKLLRQAILEMQ